MAVTASGIIKVSDIAAEFQDSTPYSLSEYYRGGAKVPNSSQNANVPTSGATKLGNFYGAVRRVALTQTFATNTTQTAIGISTLPGYVAGITDITITVNNGVYLYSTDVSSPALAISGATAGDTVTLINNGFIIGKGGAGANGSWSSFGNVNGLIGGPALSLGFNCSITNNSYIAGGGGGGGAGRRQPDGEGDYVGMGGGGGAGGGAGGSSQRTPSGFNATGGVGGGPGSSGSNGGQYFGDFGAGGGGGRILPGTGGVGFTNGSGVAYNNTYGRGGGAGGSGGSYYGFSSANGYYYASGGGSGGSGGNAGNSTASNENSGGGGGGGWGASGGNVVMNLANGGGYTYSTGGAGGKAIALNGYTVTYLTTGTLYGAVS